ncbi:DegT/DnrJ/EryC1/StrS family aminotransferase [Lichenihabitans psoromatis]|uniref:DegT/DnrJ/EryC1/StrS family aminotransferase n=1 Tax=Lichenihabitans psoromatis TaxID=2528642 RepID=UPI001FDEC7DC|nr:DegT/DnrJ/EryC1/StrS family aminotransferase [Lichenihabitans psoromatis]
MRGEVITAALTFPATPHALSWAGITPVFADIDPERLTLDPAAVEWAVTPRTTAILAFHVYGIPCDVDGLADVAKRHDLRFIYDGAHCFDTWIGTAPIGSFGDATIMSFHAMWTNSAALLECYLLNVASLERL